MKFIAAGGIEALKFFAAGVSAREVMPEIDVLFVEFPTKKNFLVVAQSGKIDQATVEIFDLNLAALELLQEGLNVGQASHAPVNVGAADVPALREEGRDPLG